MKSNLIRRRKGSIADLEDIVKVQCANGNWNYDPYMQGMANGMLLSLNVATDDPREPLFKEAPEVWLADIPMDPSIQPVSVQGSLKTATEYTDEDLAEWQEILDEETFDIPAALVERMVKLNKLSFSWKLNKRILLLEDDVYLRYDKEDHTFFYIDDIKGWLYDLSDTEMFDFVGEVEDIPNGHLGESLNEFKAHPSEVYHYTTEEALEEIRESGGLDTTSGTGLTNRFAAGVFTSVDPEEYADGTYGDICIDIDLPAFLKAHPDTQISFEPEVEECLMRDALAGALGLDDIDISPDSSGGMSYQTIIVGSAIPLKFLSIDGHPLEEAEEKMASKTAGERLRLDEIYDEEQLEDPSEALHEFISPEDLDVAFLVKTMQPAEIAKLETFRDTSTIVEMYESGAGPKQKKIVEDKMKRFDASRVIVIAGTTLLDGYHHAIAAIKLDKPVRYINVYDPPEGQEKTGSVSYTPFSEATMEEKVARLDHNPYHPDRYYHVTSEDSIQGILATGLKAKACSQAGGDCGIWVTKGKPWKEYISGACLELNLDGMELHKDVRWVEEAGTFVSLEDIPASRITRVFDWISEWDTREDRVAVFLTRRGGREEVEKMVRSKFAKVEWDMSPVDDHERAIKLTYKGKKGPGFLIYIYPRADQGFDSEVNVIADDGQMNPDFGKPYAPWVDALATPLATVQALASKLRECVNQEYNTRADAAVRAGNRALAQTLRQEASNLYQEILNDVVKQLVEIPLPKWTGWKNPDNK